MSPKTVIYIISGVFFLAFVVIFLLIRKRTINEKEKNLLIVIQTACGILSLFLAALNIIIQIIQSKPVIIYSPTEGSQTTNGFSEQALEVPSQRQTPTPMAKLTNNSTSKSTPFSVTIGSTVYFGHYEQDDNTANGKESIE